MSFPNWKTLLKAIKTLYSQYNRECIAVGDQFGKQFEIIAKVLLFTYSEEVQHLAKHLNLNLKHAVAISSHWSTGMIT